MNQIFKKEFVKLVKLNDLVIFIIVIIIVVASFLSARTGFFLTNVDVVEHASQIKDFDIENLSIENSTKMIENNFILYYAINNMFLLVMPLLGLFFGIKTVEIELKNNTFNILAYKENFKKIMNSKAILQVLFTFIFCTACMGMCFFTSMYYNFRATGILNAFTSINTTPGYVDIRLLLVYILSFVWFLFWVLIGSSLQLVLKNSFTVLTSVLLAIFVPVLLFQPNSILTLFQSPFYYIVNSNEIILEHQKYSIVFNPIFTLIIILFVSTVLFLYNKNYQYRWK